MKQITGYWFLVLLTTRIDLLTHPEKEKDVKSCEKIRCADHFLCMTVYNGNESKIHAVVLNIF